MRLILVVLLLACLCAVGGAYVWLHLPLKMADSVVDLSIEPGSNARQVALAVQQAGIDVRPALLYWTFRLSGSARNIKAGSYEIDSSTTPLTLLSKLVEGDAALGRVTLVEGWNFQQVRQALQKAEHLKSVAVAMDDADLMRTLGRPNTLPEGRFFPDTYVYSKGASDITVLERAMHAMDKKLEQAWALRDVNSPLTSADQLLILASIIEKETGLESDRPMVASVFSNRLRIGMRLQTDPTVIYGLGAAFDGNLRKVDLVTDTPYNTYTRVGLPPGPIAMPGKAALLAAIQPAQSKALYFVARGDGSSQFSETLDAHNRAVNKYLR